MPCAHAGRAAAKQPEESVTAAVGVVLQQVPRWLLDKMVEAWSICGGPCRARTGGTAGPNCCTLAQCCLKDMRTLALVGEACLLALVAALQCWRQLWAIRNEGMPSSPVEQGPSEGPGWHQAEFFGVLLGWRAAASAGPRFQGSPLHHFIMGPCLHPARPADRHLPGH